MGDRRVNDDGLNSNNEIEISTEMGDTNRTSQVRATDDEILNDNISITDINVDQNNDNVMADLENQGETVIQEENETGETRVVSTGSDGYQNISSNEKIRNLEERLSKSEEDNNELAICFLKKEKESNERFLKLEADNNELAIRFLKKEKESHERFLKIEEDNN